MRAPPKYTLYFERPLKPSTADGFRSYLNKWLNPFLGDLPLSSVNNLIVKALVTDMMEARMSPKMVGNVIQVAKMVVGSAVNENGEEVHPRTWNHEFMDQPEVKNQRQPAHSSKTMTAIVAGSEGREQMLYILLGATAGRFGEVLGLQIEKHISEDFSTLYIRQKVRNGRVQPFLKTENGFGTSICIRTWRQSSRGSLGIGLRAFCFARRMDFRYYNRTS